MYREKGLALIQKVPTPITPIKIDKEHRHITLAYFEQKSTVDYIGAVPGDSGLLRRQGVRLGDLCSSEHPRPSGGVHGRI